ncbi:hypothetical protein [Methylobacterium sp. WL7]|uniref:hypothetical protein n=1 Tax=Methylobacterium sp. WL7 TaxID=2603900 RepID=UPI0011CA61AE|nr:hypothetical protein [Methylobacterium sp. WL7]TXN47359.1 hypothetical protein FV233_04840 [Methylobacterium sp. WL7]
MLDLALALVWTPIGIAALAALAAAVAAFVYLPRLGVPFLALAVVLAGAAYVSRIQDDLGAARRERDEAKADAAGKARAIEALESVSRNGDKRARAARETHRRIQAAPASDDAPVAPVLRQVLEGGR